MYAGVGQRGAKAGGESIDHGRMMIVDIKTPGRWATFPRHPTDPATHQPSHERHGRPCRYMDCGEGDSSLTRPRAKNATISRYRKINGNSYMHWHVPTGAGHVLSRLTPHRPQPPSRR